MHLYSALNDGGGILATGLANISVYGRLDGNRAVRNGGGLATFDQANVFLRGSAIFYDNTAGADGGGIYAAGKATEFGIAAERGKGSVLSLGF